MSLNVFNMKIRNALWLLGSVLMISACDKTAALSPDERAAKVAEGFAVAYFNYDFERAAKYCNEGSMKWLKFAASQLTQEDIDKLNGKDEAQVSVEDFVRSEEGDYAIVEVSDFLRLGALNNKNAVVDCERFRIPLSRFLDKDGEEQWQVRMACLPQSERQSRD